MRALLYDLLLRYRAAPVHPPLMLSAAEQPLFAEVLPAVFAAPGQEPVPLWQVLYSTKDGAAPESCLFSLQALAQCAPYLAAPGLAYQARVWYLPAPELPGGLLRHFLLLPDAALFLCGDGRQGILETDPAAVAMLRREYARQYLALPGAQALTVLDGTAAVQRARQEFEAGAGALYCLCAAPPALPLQPAAPFHCFFTEEGLLQFAQTGALPALPAEPVRTPGRAGRRQMLEQLLRAAQSGTPEIRLLDPAALHVPPGAELCAYAERGLLFRAPCAGAAGYRTFRLDSFAVANAVAGYLAGLQMAGGTCAPEYLVRLLEHALLHDGQPAPLASVSAAGR